MESDSRYRTDFKREYIEIQYIIAVMMSIKL